MLRSPGAFRGTIFVEFEDLFEKRLFRWRMREGASAILFRLTMSFTVFCITPLSVGKTAAILEDNGVAVSGIEARPADFHAFVRRYFPTEVVATFCNTGTTLDDNYPHTRGIAGLRSALMEADLWR